MSDEPTMKKRKGVFVCAFCGAELNEIAIKNDDPFCRTKCANDYYGYIPATTLVAERGAQ